MDPQWSNNEDDQLRERVWEKGSRLTREEPGPPIRHSRQDDAVAIAHNSIARPSGSVIHQRHDTPQNRRRN